MGQAKRRTTKIRPQTVGGGIFGRFSNFDKCRPEVSGEVISDMTIEWVGMDVLAKFGDSTFKNGRIIRLFGRPDAFYALLCSI